LRLLVGAFLLWSIVTIGVVGQMAFDYSAVGSYDTSCLVGDSSGGPSHWKWWLPHGVCDYPTTGHRRSDIVEGLARVLVRLCRLVLLVGVVVGLATHIRVKLRAAANNNHAPQSVPLIAR
jgi:hypothetical protein